MRIKTVHIENFRTLDDITIQFNNVTTFIGPNGAGKSTILKALDWFFNGTKKTSLTDEDCTFGNTGENVRVEVIFTDLTNEDRQILGSYTPAGTHTFTAWKTRTPDGEETLSANGRGFAEFTEIKRAATAGAMKELYKTLQKNRPELKLPNATTRAQLEDAMRTWEARNPNELEDVPEVQTNLFGFNSNAKLAGIFDFVLVTADLRASEEAVDNKNSIIGRIIERSIDRSAADAEIQKVIAESHQKQMEIFDEAFGDQLQTVNNEINSIVGTYSQGRTVIVAPTEIDFRTPSTTFSVSIDDGEAITAIDRQGHGFQRTMLISALQLLARSNPANTNGTICLAIEEPEIYQHPTQAFTFAKVLRSLADDPVRSIQVTYATHSPMFIEARHFHEVRRLTRHLGERPCVTINSATLDDVLNATKNHVKAKTVTSQLDNTIANQLAEAIFADRALIVEGSTDAAVLYGLGDKLNPGACEASGLSIVDVRSKQNIILSHAILTSLGVPTYVLFDGDKQHKLHNRNESSTNKLSDETGTIKTNRNLLAYFGLPLQDFPDESIKPPVAAFSYHIEQFLDNNWPEWRKSLEKIAEVTDVDVTKNAEAYRSATAQAEGEAPSQLYSLLGIKKTT